MADVIDNSAIDESVKQDGMTINATNSTILSNSGNGRMMKLNWTLLGVVLIIGLLVYGRAADSSKNTWTKMDNIVQDLGRAVNDLHEEVEKSKQMSSQANETSIWLIRNDILQTIDIHEAKREITAKQYKWLKEEYDHYVNDLKGNHDVKDRWTEFNTRIFGTQSIKMVDQ